MHKVQWAQKTDTIYYDYTKIITLSIENRYFLPTQGLMGTLGNQTSISCKEVSHENMSTDL